MGYKSITVDVMIDDKIFRRFAVFDNLYRRRRWLPPAVFASILSASACVCFIMRGTAPRAVMLGCVLLLIGLGLPAVHLLSFFNSIKSQIKVLGLKKPRLTYSLCLSDEPAGIRVTNPGGESAQYEWGGLYGIYRVDGCLYLYVTDNKAFLIPDGQAGEGSAALWPLFTDMLPPEKLYDRRKVKG